MSCSICKSEYVVNKKYNLCNSCNHERLHGESLEATQKKQQQRYIINYENKVKRTKVKPIKQTPIKQITKKTDDRNKKLGKIKGELTLQLIQDNEYYCKGCGKSGEKLDFSHIISIKEREDLTLDKDNLNTLCRKCHMIWESRNIENILLLNCFEKDLYYLKENDLMWYNKMITKMIEFKEKSERFETLSFNQQAIDNCDKLLKFFDYQIS